MQFTLKSVLSKAGGILVIGIILFYAYYQSRAVIAGPEINISSPESMTTTKTSLVAISGVAIRAKAITLDGRPIFVDLNGHFYEQLLLSPGYNILVLTATDAGGRMVTKRLELVYKPMWSGITL